MSARTDIPHATGAATTRLGIAGWNLRREHAHHFSDIGTHLQRYATQFNAVEINSCFYRPHRLTTYERWASSVPSDFRFAVKLPKAITHENRLVDVAALLERFLSETAGLGAKLGPVLIQLPPSFVFDERIGRSFFEQLRARFNGAVVFEPRHESWFTTGVERMLVDYRVARVAADPARVPAAAEPGGHAGMHYYRLHGSPRTYYSGYPRPYLEKIADELEAAAARGILTWCIFDNTALGAATADALTVKARLNAERAMR